MIPPKALYIEAILSDKSIPMPMLFWYLKTLYWSLKDQNVDHHFWGDAVRHVLDSSIATREFYIKLWRNRLIRTLDEKVKAIDGSRVVTQVYRMEDRPINLPMHTLAGYTMVDVQSGFREGSTLKVAIHESDGDKCIVKRVPGIYAAVFMDDNYDEVLPMGSYCAVRVSSEKPTRLLCPNPQYAKSTPGFGVMADIHPTLATSTLHYEYCTMEAEDLVEKFFKIYPVQVSISDNPPTELIYETIFSDGPENPIAEWVRRGLMLFMQSSLPGPKTPLDFYKFMVSSWA